MKKFLIGIILIIPMIVVLSVSATGTIIGAAVPVNATRVFLSDLNAEQLSGVIETDMTEKYALYIKVLPNITYDKNVVYDAVSSDGGALELKKVNEDGLYEIIPLSPGAVRLTVRAANNMNAYSTVTVLIGANRISEIILYDEDGIITEGEIFLNSYKKLSADIIPANSFLKGSAEWQSSNTEVVTVDKNGGITPVNRGRASVTLKVFDKDGLEHSASVVVDTRNSIVSKTELFSGSPLTADDVKRIAVTSSLSTVTEISDGLFEVTDGGGGKAYVKVTACAEGDWGFTDLLTRIYTDNGDYRLSAGIFDELYKNAEYTYTFSVENGTGSAYTDGNLLVPLSAGDITVVCARSDGEIKEKTVAVRERPRYLELNYNSEDANKGIAGKRVFAVYDFDGSNTFDSGLKDKSLSDRADISFSIDNDDAATIDENGLLTVSEFASGSSVTVTAAVYLDNYETRQRAQFTFNFVGGENAVNVYGRDELYAANSAGKTLVLQNDIELNATLNLRASVYGNGMTLDGGNIPGLQRYTVLVYVISSNLARPAEPVVVSNLFIEASDSFENAANCGLGLYIVDLKTPFLLEYSALRFMNDAVQIKQCKDVTINGSILGECDFLAVQFEYDPPADADIVIKNTVFKKTKGPSILAMNNSFTLDNFNKNALPRLTIEGFADFYNWKTMGELELMLQAMNPASLGKLEELGLDVPALMGFFGTIIRVLFERKDMEQFSYKPAGDENRYVPAGIIILGMYLKADPDRVELKDDGLTLLRADVPNDNSPWVQQIKLFETLAQLVDKRIKLTNSIYMATYDMGDKPRNEPGDPVPENEELYMRLRGEETTKRYFQ